MKRFCLYLFLFSVIFTCGCSSKDVIAHKQEASQYSNSSIEISKNINKLNIEADSANIKIYCWDKEEIRLELKHTVRDYKSAEDLEKIIKKYSVTTKTGNSTVFLKITYENKKKNPKDFFSDVKLSLPENIENLELSQKNGSFVVEDKFQGSIAADLDSVNSEIKGLEGELAYRCKKGNIRLDSGKLFSKSFVDIKYGNIFIRTECREKAEYSFNTELGNINLNFPLTNKIAFDFYGTVENNQFTGNDGDINVKAKSEIGKISINGY